jgi:hypothetical protein
MKYVQDPLAKRLLAGDFEPGDIIVATPAEGREGSREGSGDGAELVFKKKRSSQVAAVS